MSGRQTSNCCDGNNPLSDGMCCKTLIEIIGESVGFSGAVTTEVTRRSWVIMNRFMEYRLRGDKPLDAKEFPLLSG